MAKRTNILTIPLPIYHLHVVVAFGITIEDAYEHARKQGCEISKEFLSEMYRLSYGADGFCSNLGDGNTDILVWLKNGLHKRSRVSEHGTLLHELYHAVDRIAFTHAIGDERECKAYLFEYLTEQCLNFFWGIKAPNKNKTK